MTQDPNQQKKIPWWKYVLAGASGAMGSVPYSQDPGGHMIGGAVKGISDLAIPDPIEPTSAETSPDDPNRWEQVVQGLRGGMQGYYSAHQQPWRRRY